MIPDFNEHGYLPPGIHSATLEEIEEHFGRGSELRRAEMQSLRWLVDAARRAGVLRIIVNGSFVADVYEPNDVDCVLLIGPDYPRNPRPTPSCNKVYPSSRLSWRPRKFSITT